MTGSRGCYFVSIDDGIRIDPSEVLDFAELFYPGKRPGIIRILFIDRKGKGRRRGECETLGSAHHTIRIFWSTIAEESARPGGMDHVGGNVMRSSDARQASFFTLAHELRHAYQAELHWHKEKFFRKRGYASRPCEVDARRYVDESYVAICDFLGIRPDPSIRPRDQDVPEAGDDPLDDLLEVLSESGTISVEELKSELSAIGMNNAITLDEMIHVLIERGVDVGG